MEEYFFRAMFATPPDPSGGEAAAARWRPGDLVTAAKLQCSITDRQRLTYTLLGDPALRMSFRAPAIDVTFNDELWYPEPGGVYITGNTNDSLTVKLSLSDESHLLAPELTDYYGEVPADSLVVVSDSAGGRSRVYHYRTQLQRRPYTFSIRVTDGDGNGKELNFSIPCEIALYQLRRGEMLPLHEGDTILSGSELVLSVRTSAHLNAADLEFSLGGERLIHREAEVTELPEQPFVWTLTYPLGEVFAAEVFTSDVLTAEVAIRQRDGELLTLFSESYPVGEGDLRIMHHWWIPSPFSEKTTLLYELSQRASRVRLRIFTAAGRRILDADSENAGTNIYPPLPLAAGVVQTGAPVWRGLDDDGDSVANGIYFYELTVWDLDGSLADRRIEKLIRMRSD